MPYTEQGKAVMLWNLSATISHISLHNGEPTEENEIKGGVYRRRQIAFRDPMSGEITSLREIDIEVPAGSRVTHAGFWNAPMGGVMLAFGKTQAETFRGRGIYRVDLAKLDLNG